FEQPERNLDGRAADRSCRAAGGRAGGHRAVPARPRWRQRRAVAGDPVDVPGTFGRYEIAERVGRGGMGVLYRGKDTVLDREVAIKVMSGDFSGDEAARGRFFREG